MNLEALKKARFKINNIPVKFTVTKYLQGGALALRIVTDNVVQESYAILTVNIPGTKLSDNEILVKTWSENEATALAALNTGLFQDTGKRIRTGFVEAEIWQVK